MRLIDLVSDLKIISIMLMTLIEHVVCLPLLLDAVDNRTWQPHAKRKHFNVGEFMEPSQTLMLSSQQRLAVYQFLTGKHYEFYIAFLLLN